MEIISNAAKVDDQGLTDLVLEFKANRLNGDHAKMANLQVQGRKILYEQIGEAYRIGQILLSPSNKGPFYRHLRSLGFENEAETFDKGKTKNKWLLVTKVLYGEWKTYTDFHLSSLSADKEGITVFQPNRSSEKYANVLRRLWDQNIAVENVVEYIENFCEPDYGAGLVGMERIDRATYADPTKDGNSKLNHLETGLNSIAFSMPKPAEIASDVKFGVMLFETGEDNLTVYECKSLTQDEFNAMAADYGRRLSAQKRKDNAQWKKQLKEINSAETQRKRRDSKIKKASEAAAKKKAKI